MVGQPHRNASHREVPISRRIDVFEILLITAAALAVAVFITFLTGTAVGQDQTDHEYTAQKLRSELKDSRHAARGWRKRAAANYDRGYRRAEAEIVARPDAWEAIQLAAIAYRQNPSHLRACARSEGYRDAERFIKLNARPNRGGSGAFGMFQFMRGTFLSTPYAGLDWRSQAVQAHAAAWMWANGRRGEWAGRGC